MLAIVYRQSKGGSWRVLVDGAPTGKGYMSQSQAVGAARKAVGFGSGPVAVLPEPADRHHMITAAEALVLAAQG